ncbi:hypothetical protein [Flavobacterium sp. '19STA2R22 D10 B1']|uniref:hypothetical protein n=1 Tax=Flavobacterium aerium TaxID=3037261 RepID=UPI00278C3F00|nr:hypothetical protein [Flavobacterium sp. '19STA2R22 D10 B1']
MKTTITTVFLLFVLHTATAQSISDSSFFDRLTIDLGYTNFNGNLLKAGSSFFVAGNKTFLVNTGVHVYLGYLNDSFTAIPELNATAYYTKSDFIPFVRTGLMPRTFTPEVGISFLTAVELSGGYGIKMGGTEHPNTEGFRVNIGISIPLVTRNMRLTYF